MRRIPIRAKLAAALAVPLLVMGMVTLLEVIEVSREADDVRAQTDLATATTGPNGLITALQGERNWSTAYLSGFDQQLELEITGWDETRALVDEKRAEFEADLGNITEAARAAYEPALARLDELDALREEIDQDVETLTPGLQNMPRATEIFDRFNVLVDPFFAGMSRISIAMDDPELRQGASLMETVTRQTETVARMANAMVLPGIASTSPGDTPGINQPAEIAKLAEIQDDFRRQAAELRAATGPYEAITAANFPTEFTDALDEISSAAIERGTVSIDELVAGLEAPSLEEAYLGYRDALADALIARADDLSSSAAARQQRFAALMLVTFVAAVALTVLVSLSITRPLRALTRQARGMADRLPGAVGAILDTPLGDDVSVPTVSPVQVTTRDEVADVARALNTVQDSALDLAVEQAVLRRNIADSFVNLGRRNQNLLGRQLDFITELETNETDPDALSSLFRLDHLATRMRRNAESLLVLAGIAPPRQWTAPVPLGDVIRAALGEVEDYQRVTVRSVEPATVQGSAATDLAHLLAELIENALVFSPPDRSVEIRGRSRPAHDHDRPGGYALAIVDAGLGMPAHDIESANRRLAGDESFTVAPSKYLGHYVAGNLAGRHGIDVRLQSSPGGGTTASVHLPPEILTGGAAGGLPGGAAGGLPAGGPSTPDDRNGRAQLAPAAGGPTRNGSPAAPLAGAASFGGPAPTAPDRATHRAPLAASATDAQLSSLARAAGRSAPPPTQNPWQGQPPASPAGPRPQAPQPYAPQSPAPQPPAPQPYAPQPYAPQTPAPQPPLARRERGAQLPSTTMRPLRRERGAGGPGAPGAGPGPAPAGPPSPPAPTPPPVPPLPQPPSPAGGGAPTGRNPEAQRAANEVYSFLSTFTAGVQRGLDASREDDGGGAGWRP